MQHRVLRERRQWRMFFLTVILLLTSGTIFLILSALRTSVIFFYGPSEALAQNFSYGTPLRLGGLVAMGSVTHEDNQRVRFHITDGNQTVAVEYTGFLPDLFREGQGVVVEGQWENSRVVAHQVLAKHDERYMPPEVADVLKKEGHWKES
jgi:cytochrome c-type biogenesis protein CcmE